MNIEIVKIYGIPVVLFVVIFVGLIFIRNIIFKTLKKWAQLTKSNIDDIIIQSLRVPSILWSFIIAFTIAVGLFPLPEKLNIYIQNILTFIVVISVTIALANIINKVIEVYAKKIAPELPVTGVTKVIVIAIVYSVGILIALDSIGIKITPLLTALGVGGLAVGLALRDTLSNLFSGIYIVLERNLKIGDFVETQDGITGIVEDIGWRTTKIRELANNIIVIPNEKLAQTILKNYELPEKKLSLVFDIGVSYDSDIEKVKKIIIEECMKYAKETGNILEIEPLLRFKPSDFSLDFTIIVKLPEIMKKWQARSDLYERLFKRFNQEGIEIPFPIRTVYLRKEDNNEEIPPEYET